MERAVRFELTTGSLENYSSPTELYPRFFYLAFLLAGDLVVGFALRFFAVGVVFCVTLSVIWSLTVGLGAVNDELAGVKKFLIHLNIILYLR